MRTKIKRRKIEFASPSATDKFNELDKDWRLYFICQKKAKGKLQCSCNVSNTNKGSIKSSYIGLAERMLSFQKSNMPTATFIEMAMRDDNKRCQLEMTMIWGLCLINNKASFHESCKRMFNSSKLDCAKSKHKDDSNDHNDKVPVQTRVSKLLF